MFNYIKGLFVSSGDGYVVVETGGIGFNIYTSLNTLGRVAGQKEVVLYTYMYLREGIMDLYGFATEEERTLFLQLISISGVGPKAAVSVLSVAPAERIAMAIITGDYKLIQKAQGVGVKVAQRIVMELKDKLKGINVSEDDIAGAEILTVSDNGSEALSALMVLGYSENEAKKALKNIDLSGNTEDIIKEALKAMF